MILNNDYISSFSERINSDSRQELKETLIAGRKDRLQSDKHTYFWDFDRRKLHSAFDAVYAEGIKKLAESASKEALSLTGRTTGTMPASEMGKMAVKVATIGLGGFGGWLVGLVYTQSMTNDIPHEYGHYWADYMMSQDANPVVSTNAWYWLEHGEWKKWFWGDRAGGPGNWTAAFQGPLTEFGKLLSPIERDLFTTSAGLGAELIVNTTIAGLGLLSLRKKRYVLGAALLGFASISHSAAFSYINRYKDQMTGLVPFPTGGDPAQISKDIAQWLGWSVQEAYHLLYYGYLFFPIVLLGFLSTLFLRTPQEVPDECVLMRLLVEKEHSPEMKKVLAELEIEMANECAKMDKLEEGKEKQEITWEICHRLIDKIKENEKTLPIFEKKLAQITEEINGKLNKATSSILFKLRGIASLIAFVAYQILTVGKTLIPALAKAFYYLSGAFIALQGVSFVMETVQTIIDVCNEKFTALAKALSVSRTAVSLGTLVVVALSLLVPGLNYITIPAMVISLALRVILYLVHLYESRSRAYKHVEQSVDNPKLIDNSAADEMLLKDAL